MKRRIMSVILLGFIVALSVSEVGANGYWFPIEYGSLLGPITALNHKHMTKTTIYAREEYEFNWTTGVVPVNFHIMNDVNYLNWSTGQPWTGLVNHLNITGEAFSWETNGANATHHFIWYNPTMVSTNIVGEWHRSRWIEVEGDIPGFPVEALLLGLAITLGVTIIIRQRQKRL